MQFKSGFACESLDALPAPLAVAKRFGPANHADLTMSQPVEVLDSSIAAGFVVYLHGTEAAGGKVAAYANRRDIVLADVAQQIKLGKEPVGDHDQALHAQFEQHL